MVSNYFIVYTMHTVMILKCPKKEDTYTLQIIEMSKSNEYEMILKRKISLFTFTLI